MMTVCEAAKRLGVTRQRVHELVKSGRIVVTTRHKRILFLGNASVEKVRAELGAHPRGKHAK